MSSLIKILEEIDNKISMLWDNKYTKERAQLFELRGKVCEMIQNSQRKRK